MTNNWKDSALEGSKTAGRWVFFFLISVVLTWFLNETLNQVSAVPESYQLKLWVFAYMIPVRGTFQLGLTLLLGAVDKFIHEWNQTRLNGISPI